MKHTIIALAVVAGLAGLASAGAQAFPVQPAPGTAAASADLWTEARAQTRYERDNVRSHEADGRGMRCDGWSDRCRYQHDGFYYESPWWVVPIAGAGAALGAAGAYATGAAMGDYGSRHMRWCQDRYRSYNPRTNTWVSNSGRTRQCVSPYTP